MQLNRREFLNVMAAGSACGMFGSWASAAQAAAKGERLYDIPRAGNVSFFTLHRLPRPAAADLFS